MELKGMTCPKCGSQLNFTEDQDYCFCSHCGTQVYKNNTNETTVTYKEIDQAKLKEIEYKNKKFDFFAGMDKEKAIKLILLSIVVIFVVLIGLVLLFGKDAVIVGLFFTVMGAGIVALAKYVQKIPDADDDN